jgi:hypothetical protein
MPATAAASQTAYAGSQSLLLAGRSVSPNGDAFWNGTNMAPVSLVYKGRLYIAARFAASIAHLSISWQRKRQMVVLGGPPPRVLMGAMQAASASFHGPISVQTRHVRLVVRRREWTPAGRSLQIGGHLLPDALYAMRTMYMPASLLATALGLKLTWPPHTTPTGLYAHISLPVSTLQPGSVLGVAAIVGGVPAGDPLGFTWTLRNPEGNLVPLMGGNNARQEQVPFGVDAARGTYRLAVTVTDGRSGQRTTAFADVRLSGAAPAGLSRPSFGFTPQTIARAYDIYNTWLGGDFGQGQAIVLYERQGFSYQDISTFDNVFGLPAPSIHVVSLSGQQLPTGMEATMDIEWAHALAPLSQLIVVEDSAGSSAQAFPSNLVGALQAQARDGAEIASVSWGVSAGSGPFQNASQSLAALEAEGFSLFAAGGDNFDLSGPPQLWWPAVDPSSIAVGGTSLWERTPASFFETYWNNPPTDASTFGQAAWQQRVTGDAMRQVPDVAFDGNPRTGVAVYMDGDWWWQGGTSLGAPAWAAIWALCREAVPYVPAASQSLYTVAASRYGAGALRNPNGDEYDPRTGIGSPDVADLISALRALY